MYAQIGFGVNINTQPHCSGNAVEMWYRFVSTEIIAARTTTTYRIYETLEPNFGFRTLVALLYGMLSYDDDAQSTDMESCAPTQCCASDNVRSV